MKTYRSPLSGIYLPLWAMIALLLAKAALLIFLVAMPGCASVHRSASGRVTADYTLGSARGAVAIMEASADVSANDTSLDICREAVVAQRACMAFDSRTGRPLVVIGGGVIPSGYFGQSSMLSAAAAIGESERLRLEVARLRGENAGLRSDVGTLTSGE